MSRLEEHGAYWHENEDDGYKLVYKRYEPNADLIATVYARQQAYRGVIFEKVPDPNGGRPTWIERRPATLFSSQSDAEAAVERLVRHAYIVAATTVELPEEFNTRDRRGVPVRNGRNVIPTWKSMLLEFLVTAILSFMFPGAFFFVFRWLPLLERKHPSVPPDVLAERFTEYLTITVGVSMLAAISKTAHNISVRNKLKKLQAVTVFANQFAVSPDDIQRIAAARRIMPQVNINGIDYYNPRDFGDMTTLLQPASAPSNDVLLKPVSATLTNEEVLLRSSLSSDSKSDSSH
jgi:hypothetical protein